MEGVPKKQSKERELPIEEGSETDVLADQESIPTAEGSSFEALDKVTESARVLQGYMNERGGFTKQLFSPTQAEVFSHTFEMATESIKAGDVNGFNQEIGNLDSCFEGYGTNIGEGMRDDLDSIRNVKEEFGVLRKNFDIFTAQAEELSGVNLDQLDYLKARFGQIDDFHSQLYEVTAKFLEPEDEAVEASRDKQQVEQDGGIEQEKRFYFARMIDDMTDDARIFGSKLQQRYENNVTHQLMSPSDASSFINGLENASEAIKKGDDNATIEAFEQVARSFGKYGNERGTASAMREDVDNLSATTQVFSRLSENFSRLAAVYENEQGNPEITNRLRSLKEGLSRVDEFNRQLKQRAEQMFGRY